MSNKSFSKYIDKYKRELKALYSEKDMLQTQINERVGLVDISYYFNEIEVINKKITFWENALKSY